MSQSTIYEFTINIDSTINYKDFNSNYLNTIQGASFDPQEKYDNYIKRILLGNQATREEAESKSQEHVELVSVEEPNAEDNTQSEATIIPKMVWPDGVIAPQDVSDNIEEMEYDPKYDLPPLPPSKSNRMPFGGIYDEHSFDYLKVQINGVLKQTGSPDYIIESMV
jgi:hypothetical protein